MSPAKKVCPQLVLDNVAELVRRRGRCHVVYDVGETYGEDGQSDDYGANKTCVGRRSARHSGFDTTGLG